MYPVAVALLLQVGAVQHVVVAPAETLTVATAGSGTNVVLIPGLFGAVRMGAGVEAELAPRGYRVITIEPLAVGSSSRPRRANYTLDAQARRVAAVLDSLGATSAVVVGQGTHASLVLRLALLRPDLVRGIIALEGAGAERIGSPGFRRAMRYAPWIKWAGGTKRVRGIVGKSLRASSGDTTWVTESAIDAYTAGAQADLDGTLHAFLAMSEAKEPQKLAPQLSRLNVPVQIMLGGAEHSSGPSKDEVRDVVRALPNAQVVTVPGAGHHLAEERPDAVTEAIVTLNQELTAVSGEQ